MGMLTAVLVALLAQDDAAKMEWAVVDGDRFDLTWSFSEQAKGELGRGEPTDTHDKRDVVAELAWKADGVMSLTLKKIVWNHGTQDYDITLAWTEGKKVEPQAKLKLGEKAPGYAVQKSDMDRWLETLKKATEGEYTVDVKSEQGRTQFFWNNGSVRTPGLPCVLNRLFTHPTLPSGPVRVGQLFKDPLDVTNLTAGLTEVKEVESKVTAVGDKGLIAKGGVNIPVGKSIVANGQTQMMTGSFIYTCEWNYAPQGYLQASKEESKFSKKVDAKGKDADFYRGNWTHNIVQALTIKKKPADPNRKPAPPKPEAKPEEPKQPEGDKKPDEN